MIIELLTISLCLCWLIQLALWVVFGRVIRRKQAARQDMKEGIPISVIICARNEAENIKKNLPLILSQDYPEFELIVVNDDSSDHTEEVLKKLNKIYSNLIVINAEKPEHLKGKRFALKQGIRRSKYEHILLTDADCAPSSDQWIRKMSSRIGVQIEVVLGLGPYYIRPSWVNTFSRYENLYTAMLYSSSARLGIPFMGVGRNILYRKSEIHTPILDEEKISGDDDLMVNQISHALNTEVVMDENALCFSEAPTNWSSFWKQKRRHVTASIEYRFVHVLWLNLINGTQALFHLFSLILIFYIPIAVLLLALSRWLLMIIAFRPLFKLSGSGKMALSIPVLDYTLSLYFLLLAPSLIWKKREW